MQGARSPTCGLSTNVQRKLPATTFISRIWVRYRPMVTKIILAFAKFFLILNIYTNCS
jgi:hypothetical protein